jgi:hypothetical protein
MPGWRGYVLRGSTGHPAGEVTLQSAIFDVQDPQAVRAHWHKLFGFNESPEGLAVGEQRFILPVRLIG